MVAGTVRQALQAAVQRLTAAGCDTPRLDAEMLLADVLGVDRALLIADGSRALDPADAAAFAERVHRREAREPVAYILGRRGFRTLELEVGPGVLVPRPETEHLVEAALSLPHGARVVDVGTGSGAVALALKAERPDLQVSATDRSTAALEIARRNARELELEVELLAGDLLEPVRGAIDAVVSNPPYVALSDMAELPPDVAAHEPHDALAGGEDGLDVHRRLVAEAARRGAGFIALEVGQGQAPAVSKLVRASGFTQVDVQPDLAGIDRVVVGRTARPEAPC